MNKASTPAKPLPPIDWVPPLTRAEIRRRRKAAFDANYERVIAERIARKAGA